MKFSVKLTLAYAGCSGWLLHRPSDRSAALFGIGDGLLDYFGVVEGDEKRYSVVHCDAEGRALFYVVDVYDAVVGDGTNLREYGALVVEIED